MFFITIKSLFILILYLGYNKGKNETRYLADEYLEQIEKVNY